MAAQNFKEEDWGNGDTKLGQNWHKNFQAWLTFLLFKLNSLHKAGKTVAHAKTAQLALMKNLKFATLPFKTDIPQAVTSLVLLGIASSIKESVSASDKLSNFESAEA